MVTIMNAKEISIKDLWQCPVVSERDAARMLGLPISSWALLKRTENLPVFGIGKRNFLITGDLIKWLEHRRETWTPRTPKRGLSRVG
jgi:hypothetical protein